MRPVVALALVVACSKSAPPEAAAPAAAPASAAAPAPAATACTPGGSLQAAGRASVRLVGEGLDVDLHDVPALCGVKHLEATHRFAVGDGTLFRACVADGVLSISSDVRLTGKVDPTFKVESYKQTGPLLEFTFASSGKTYNQRNVPRETDKLEIAFDWKTADLAVDLVWPADENKVVHAVASWRCPGG